MGAPDVWIIWCFFRLILLNFVGLGQGWQTFLKALAQIVDDFWRNPFTCGNLIFLTQHFQLFQWHPSTPYEVGAQAAIWLACPLVQPWHQITYVAYIWKLFIQGILLQMTYLPHCQNKNHNNDFNNKVGCPHQTQWKHFPSQASFCPIQGSTVLQWRNCWIFFQTNVLVI